MADANIEKSLKQFLLSNIRSISDFTEPGIVYKDITPLLNNKYLSDLTSRLLANPFRGQKTDHVTESGGFLFGTNLALDLHSGFISITKPDKLPSETETVEYKPAYGTDRIEIYKDALNPGERVGIHDDLIATGGNFTAAGKLIKTRAVKFQGIHSSWKLSI